MRTPRRHLLLAVAIVAVSAACNDTSSGGSDASTSASGSEQTTGSSGVDDSTVDGSAVTTTSASGVTTTSVAGATTTVAGGTGAVTSVPVPPASDPFATTPEPDPTEPDDMPGPPADDCVDAVAGPATVEIGFDDDRVVYAGTTAPSCVRIHAAQTLVLHSASGAASTVLVGAEVYEIAAGATATTAALGSLYGVGEVFDVYIEHLDVTIVVQVLP